METNKLTKEIIIEPGTSIDEAYHKLKQEYAAVGKVCWCYFNGKIMYSTDTIDDMYKKLHIVEKNEQTTHLTLNDYQKKAMETCLPSCKNDMYMLFGLVEEVGELSGKISKAIRKEQACVYENSIRIEPSEETEYLCEKIKSELGDCLWFISGIARQFGWSLDNVAQYNLNKLAERKESGTIVTHTDH